MFETLPFLGPINPFVDPADQSANANRWQRSSRENLWCWCISGCVEVRHDLWRVPRATEDIPWPDRPEISIS